MLIVLAPLISPDATTDKLLAPTLRSPNPVDSKNSFSSVTSLVSLPSVLDYCQASTIGCLTTGAGLPILFLVSSAAISSLLRLMTWLLLLVPSNMRMSSCLGYWSSRISVFYYY